MSLPSEVLSMYEDWYNEALNHYLELGVDEENAAKLAKVVVEVKMHDTPERDGNDD